MRISARQIELFQMAYAMRSARRAAEALNVSQPSISRAVSEIETELGVMLFDRSGRKFEPTSAGHSLHRFVQRHYRGLDRIHESAHAISDGAGGYLRLAALPSIADTIAVPAIGRLMARFPELRIDLEILGERDCLTSLRAGKSDCAIISSDPRDTNLATEILAELTPVVILAKTDALSGNKHVVLSDLTNRDMVMLPAQSPFRIALERDLEKAKTSFQVRCEVRTQTAAAELAALGVGTAVVGKQVLLSVQMEDAVAVPLVTEVSWPVRLVASHAEISSPTMVKLIKELRREAKQHN
ncbi:MAG: LysR family transcriptional regulator [Rhodobacteraceae bacterium]|nr:LysR family transcriptional regulator [Paracoccaceae bacterium]